MIKTKTSARLMAFFSSLGLAVSALAFEGEVSFSADEIATHARQTDKILADAADCLKEDLDYHQDFFRRYGVAGFYGDRSAYAKLSSSGRRAHLRSLGKSPELAERIYPTSCVGLTLKCLGRGFRSVGAEKTWAKIEAYTRANAVDGTAMQAALQKLGWKIYYWNPDVSRNEVWDAKEKAADSANKLRFWGYHAYRWSTVKNKKTYYENRVDDAQALVNFGEATPRAFREIPFYVGTAHTGYHVFPGSFGQVIEGHSTRAITDPQTLESSEFNPLKNGGGPRGSYYSGLIAIPPGQDL
ncbi:MAG TPA: hypothetical protein VM901_00730 [Bdellovibrionota bacterium]|nr:hypothetical protein [Bdellovibrionota bacterium]